MCSSDLRGLLHVGGPGRIDDGEVVAHPVDKADVPRPKDCQSLAASRGGLRRSIGFHEGGDARHPEVVALRGVRLGLTRLWR